MAEQSDHLHYIDDIFALGIPDLTGVLFLILLQRLFLPFYVHSLTKRHPPSASDSSVIWTLLYSDLHHQPFILT